jgi:hypothetical protein
MLVAGMCLPGYRGLQIGLPAGAAVIAAWSRHRPDAAYVATEGPAILTRRSWCVPVASARLGRTIGRLSA